MYYFCFFNLFGLFFSLFSRQMCKSSSRNRFPNLWKRKGWRFKWIGYHFNLFFECKVTNNFLNNRGHFKKMSLLIHFHKPLKNKQKRYEQIINFQRTKNEVGTLLHKWGKFCSERRFWFKYLLSQALLALLQSVLWFDMHKHANGSSGKAGHLVFVELKFLVG